jgi:predicted transcriptional regulator
MTDNQPSSSGQGDAEIVLAVLTSVEKNQLITQRTIASELGIALGLANAYLKRCIRKGFIKITSAPPRRYAYYLTAQGFREKSRLTTQYLHSSFSFFRSARRQCELLMLDCAAREWRRIALYGVSELAEVALLCSREQNVEIIGIFDPSGGSLSGMPALSSLSDVGPWDAVLLTVLNNPQAAYDHLIDQLPDERLLTPRLLNVTRRIVDSSSVLRPAHLSADRKEDQ